MSEDGKAEEPGRQMKRLMDVVGGVRIHPAPQPLDRQTINKKAHRIRFENETEDEVTIVIEKREEGSKR